MQYSQSGRDYVDWRIDNIGLENLDFAFGVRLPFWDEQMVVLNASCLEKDVVGKFLFEEDRKFMRDWVFIWEDNFGEREFFEGGGLGIRDI